MLDELKAVGDEENKMLERETTNQFDSEITNKSPVAISQPRKSPVLNTTELELNME